MRKVLVLFSLLMFVLFAATATTTMASGQQYPDKPVAVQVPVKGPCTHAPNVYKGHVERARVVRRVPITPAPQPPPCNECDLIKALIAGYGKQQEVISGELGTLNGIVKQLTDNENIRDRADYNRSEAAEADAKAHLTDAQANLTHANAEAEELKNEESATSPQGMLTLARANLLNRTLKHPNLEEARRWVGTFIQPAAEVIAAREFGYSLRPDQFNSSTVNNAAGGNSTGSTATATGTGGSSSATGGTGNGGQGGIGQGGAGGQGGVGQGGQGGAGGQGGQGGAGGTGGTGNGGTGIGNGGNGGTGIGNGGNSGTGNGGTGIGNGGGDPGGHGGGQDGGHDGGGNKGGGHGDNGYGNQGHNNGRGNGGHDNGYGNSGGNN